MILKIREIFTPPAFEDADETLAANILLGVITMVVGVTFLLSFPLAIMLPAGNFSIFIQGVAVLGISTLIYFMVRRGAVRQASIILLGLFFPVLIWAAYTGGGIQGNAFMNFMLLILTAGLLLGSRAGFIMTILCALLGLGFMIAEINGIMPEAVVVQTPFTSWFSSIAVLSLVAVLQGISARTTRQALKNAHDAETRYRTLVEQIPAVTYLDVTSPLRKTEYVSPQVTQMFGIEPEE